MEAYELRAYECMGYWTIVVVCVQTNEQGNVERYLLYKGDHDPIDESDPYMRAVLLLSRVEEDLSGHIVHAPADEAIPPLNLVN